MSAQIKIFSTLITGLFIHGIGCFFYAADACAQIFGESGEDETKPDLSKPDEIERPPMDPYSLSYIPEKPEGALDIQSREDCVKHGGEWKIDHFGDVLISFVCEIGNQKEGISYIVLNRPDKRDESLKAGISYCWYIHDKKAGWSVELYDAGSTVKSLIHYRNGIKEGYSFQWDKYGTLIEAKGYKDNTLDGKYELYTYGVPALLGQYREDRPVGIWKIYNPPGNIAAEVNYDKDYSELDGNVKNAYWTVWYTEGHKIKEGYAVRKSVGDVTPFYVGEQQFYALNGNKWLKMNYESNGEIDDENIMSLCSQYSLIQPTGVNFDHRKKVIHCMKDDKTTRAIQYYSEDFPWIIKTFGGNGELDGYYAEYHDNHTLAVEGRMYANRPINTFSYFDKNGNLRETKHYSNLGEKKWEVYWPNGKLYEQGAYNMGQKEGVWKEWGNNGSIRYEMPYVNNLQHGVYKQYYDNNVLNLTIDYDYDSINGDYKVYNAGGVFTGKATFKDDEFVDTSYDYWVSGTVKDKIEYTGLEYNYKTEYYEDGSKRAEGQIVGNFFKDNRVGVWNFYLKDGTKWQSVEYDKDGTILSPDSALCTQMKGNYVFDDLNREMGCIVSGTNRKDPLNPHQYREGRWTWWNENGKPNIIGHLHYGRLDGQWTYYFKNDTPMLTGTYSLNKKVGEWKGYYEDGKEKFSGKYKDGKEDGEWKTFYPDGSTISSVGAFVNGKRTGEWLYLYPSGKKKESGMMEKGKETGVWTKYYETGEKIGEGKFVDGKREGQWTWWRHDGSVWRTVNYVDGHE